MVAELKPEVPKVMFSGKAVYLPSIGSIPVNS
jgi:hypothetical protein